MLIKCLTIQILLELAPQFDRQTILDTLHAIGRFPEIDEDEDGKWIAFNLFTEDLHALWTELGPVLEQPAMSPLMHAAGIVVCEGDGGWADDRVLFHHDSTVALDELP